MGKVNEVEHKDTDAFLSALDPALPKNQKCIFRGQSDDSYKLIPSVWRDASINSLYQEFDKKTFNNDELFNFVKEMIQEHNLLWDEELLVLWLKKVKFENYLLAHFYYETNKAGLFVDKSTLNKCNTYKPVYWLDGSKNNWWTRYEFLRDGILGMSPVCTEPSFPQHYGLPTRVLDWSTNPRKAAFFAAYSLLREEDQSGYLSVYSLDMVNNISEIKVLNVHERYLNKYLHAQDGLFTTIHGDRYYLQNRAWPSIEDLDAGDSSYELIKHKLPKSMYFELLKRLENCGITIASLMPDHVHVAEHVKLHSIKSFRG